MTDVSRTLMLSAVAVAALALGAGCESKPKTGTVSGQVTFKGKPYTDGGVVTFTPADATVGSPVTTTINPDGTYSAANVPYGELRVGVAPGGMLDEEDEKYRGLALENIPEPARTRIAAIRAAKVNKPVVPDKYRDPLTSGLTFTLSEPNATHTVAVP